jgi:hypothetical protein
MRPFHSSYQKEYHKRTTGNRIAVILLHYVLVEKGHLYDFSNLSPCAILLVTEDIRHMSENDLLDMDYFL